MRKFGIEIECYLPSIDNLKQELSNSNISFLHVSYDEKHKVYQCVKLINEITLKPVDDLESIEINLPPSTDFSLLEKVCDVLNKVNANACYPKCALHIHTNVKDIGYENAKKIMEYYKEHEHEILKKISQIQNDKISTLNSSVSEARKIRNTHMSLDVSYLRYQTIEHRAFCGSTNYEEIKSCVLLTQNIIEQALKGQELLI